MCIRDSCLGCLTAKGSVFDAQQLDSVDTDFPEFDHGECQYHAGYQRVAAGVEKIVDPEHS